MEMPDPIKFSTVLSIFGQLSDRFCASGYKQEKSIEELFIDARKVDDLSGVELIGNLHVNEKNIDFVKNLSHDYSFKIPSIVIEIFSDPKWYKGSFSSSDPLIRKEAIEGVKKYMDIANGLGCNLLNLWFAQDGYDYIFQTDYINSWNFLMDGLAECSDYRKDVRLSVEYKIKEPRTHCYLGTLGKTLAMVNEINKENLGITIDIGHSFNAYENPAESIALCKLFKNKLFHLHINDNYRLWDDDMLVSSVHLIEFLEIFYWLERIGYKDWYSVDIYPYREDSISAVDECIKWSKSIIKTLNSVSKEEIGQVISKNDAIMSMRLLREILFK